MRNWNVVCTYLRIEIIDLSDGGINVASMDSPSYFYARLDGLFLERETDVRFFGEPLRSSRVALTDQVVHDDKIDIPVLTGQKSCRRTREQAEDEVQSK